VVPNYQSHYLGTANCSLWLHYKNSDRIFSVAILPTNVRLLFAWHDISQL